MDDIDDPEETIKPMDIDTKKHFFASFGNMEREVSACWIVKLLQDKNPEEWEKFTTAELDKRHRMLHGNDFRFNGIEEYLIPLCPQCSGGVATSFCPQCKIHYAEEMWMVSEEFIQKCHKASPLTEEEWDRRIKEKEEEERKADEEEEYWI